MSNTEDLRTRIAALEYLVGVLLAQQYAALDPEQVQHLRQMMRRRLSEQSLAKTTDPALSDHLSAEIAEHVDRIFAAAEKMHAATHPR